MIITSREYFVFTKKCWDSLIRDWKCCKSLLLKDFCNKKSINCFRSGQKIHAVVFGNYWEDTSWINIQLEDVKRATSTLPLWDGKFYVEALCVGHSLNKIPYDLLYGSLEEMDHPLKADVATTHRALWKQCDPWGPTKAHTEADTSKTQTSTHGS